MSPPALQHIGVAEEYPAGHVATPNLEIFAGAPCKSQFSFLLILHFSNSLCWESTYRRRQGFLEGRGNIR
jgi:hypothetical protein